MRIEKMTANAKILKKKRIIKLEISTMIASIIVIRNPKLESARIKDINFAMAIRQANAIMARNQPLRESLFELTLNWMM